jgi:ABC-2 type transport system ATP-binding protein
MDALSVRNLKKVYGELVAVDSISFSVQRKEIVGLLGPNGAGKTTTINMILSVLEPSSGTVEINGVDVWRDRSHALEQTNFAAVYAQLPGNLSVRQNLRIFGMLYGVERLEERIDYLISRFDLVSLADTRTGFLSSGEQTRVAVAKAMLNSPALLLLDEPTASMDPSTARTIRESIKEFVRECGSGVLWTSHNMHEVEEVCDRVLFLSHGKILLEGDPKTLPHKYGKTDLEELFITVAREPLSLERI